MAGQGRPSRQSAPEQAERQAWRVLVMVLKAKLEAVEAGITTITGFQEQDMPTNKGPEKQIGKDDVAAGAAGAAVTQSSPADHSLYTGSGAPAPA